MVLRPRGSEAMSLARRVLRVPLWGYPLRPNTSFLGYHVDPLLTRRVLTMETQVFGNIPETRVGIWSRGYVLSRASPGRDPQAFSCWEKQVPFINSKTSTVLSSVNPGLINPWLINTGVSPFGGDSSLLEGPPP